MRNPEAPDRHGSVQMADLPGPESAEADPGPDPFRPKPEEVQKTAGEGDRFSGAHEPDLTHLQHQAMDE